MDVRLATNLFRGVPFPLVLGDRFFSIYDDGNGQLTLNVFRWDVHSQLAYYEVEAGRPLRDNIEASPTGVITFGSADGAFEFKFRPKPGVSQIFGRVPMKDDLCVVLKDRSLKVFRGDTEIVDIMQCMLTGFPIGVRVGVDGTIEIGVSDLPSGMNLVAA